MGLLVWFFNVYLKINNKEKKSTQILQIGRYIYCRQIKLISESSVDLFCHLSLEIGLHVQYDLRSVIKGSLHDLLSRKAFNK